MDKIDLKKLARKIANIEEKDVNYKDNPKWQELTKTQEQIFLLMAREELANIDTIKNNEKLNERKAMFESFVKYVEKEKTDEQSRSH